jgi:hypothetical protein
LGVSAVLDTRAAELAALAQLALGAVVALDATVVVVAGAVVDVGAVVVEVVVVVCAQADVAYVSPASAAKSAIAAIRLIPRSPLPRQFGEI